MYFVSGCTNTSSNRRHKILLHLLRQRYESNLVLVCHIISPSMVHTYHAISPFHHALMLPRIIQNLGSLTSTQSNDLTVLLQLGDELITLLDNIGVSVSQN
jgi:hypothetical protein